MTGDLESPRRPVDDRAPARERQDGPRGRPIAPLRVQETFVGRGRLLDDGRVLGDVEYSLKAVHGGREPDGLAPQLTIADRVPADLALPAPGPADAGEGVYGTLRALDRGEATSELATRVGARLELALADGRTLPVTVVRTLRPRLFLAVAIGPLR